MRHARLMRVLIVPVLLAMLVCPLLPVVGVAAADTLGDVVFGDDYRPAPGTPGRYEIVGPRTTFAAGMSLAFVAHLDAPAGAPAVAVTLAAEPSVGKAPPPTLAAFDVPVDPAGTTVVGRIDADELATLLRDSPRGPYVLTVARPGTRVRLARGKFEWDGTAAQRQSDLRTGWVTVGLLTAWAACLPLGYGIYYLVFTRRRRGGHPPR